MNARSIPAGNQARFTAAKASHLPAKAAWPGGSKWPASAARPHPQAAFSLVEVALALGIMGFALVGLMGLLPIGLRTFYRATDLSTGGQIAQRLMNEAQQTDFTVLTGASTANTPTVPAVRYFDDQGNELANATGAIYYSNLAVTATATTLPGAAPNQYLATISLQIANNPGHVILTTGTNKTWNSAPGVSISCYAANVARNN